MHLFSSVSEVFSCSLPPALAKEVLMKRAGVVFWNSANILRSEGPVGRQRWCWMWGWFKEIPWSTRNSSFIGNGRFFLVYAMLPDLMLPVFEKYCPMRQWVQMGAGLCEDLCALSCGAWCISLQLTIWSVEGLSLRCGMVTLLARIHLDFRNSRDKPTFIMSKAYQKMLGTVYFCSRWNFRWCDNCSIDMSGVAESFWLPTVAVPWDAEGDWIVALLWGLVALCQVDDGSGINKFLQFPSSWLALF